MLTQALYQNTDETFIESLDFSVGSVPFTHGFTLQVSNQQLKHIQELNTRTAQLQKEASQNKRPGFEV